eukprot:XP_001700200.1 predicted protein [Chlamydomonas reinhardtii]
MTHISLRVAVPRHAFRWRFTVAIAAALPLRTRRELLCATAASGDVSNLEHALEVTGLDLGAAATATALLAAAACAEPPGGMAVTAFLLHRMGRSQQHQQDTRSADTEGHGEELIEAETSAQIPDIGRRQQQPLVLPTTIALSRHIGKAVLAALRGGHLPLAALLQEQQHQLHQGRRPQLQRLQSQAAMVEVAANTAAASGAAAGDGAMAATTGDEWAALLEAAAAGLALRPLQLVVLCGGDLRKATAWVQEQTAQMTDSELAAAAAAAAAAHTRQLATWQLSAVVSAAAGSLQAVGSWADKLDWLTTEPPRGLGFPRPAAAAVAVVASAGSGMEAAEVALQRLQWLRVSGVPALRLLHKYGCAIEPYGTLLVAAESGDLAAVRWLLTGQQDEQEAPEEGGEHNRGGATTTSPVASQVRLDAEVMGAAASSGHVPLMSWLLRRRGCAMDRDTFRRCAAGGSVAALRWLAAAGCDIGDDGGAYAAAAGQGDRLVAAALQQLGCRRPAGAEGANTATTTGYARSGGMRLSGGAGGYGVRPPSLA